MMHECPRDGCAALVPPEMLACRRDWYRVPPPLRAAVWRAWRNGAGSGTAEHVAALRAAIDAMNREG